MEKRAVVYIQRPREFGIPPCSCGNTDPDWSEWRERLWCQKCQKDFVPTDWGVLDGPTPIGICEAMGIFFDQVDLVTGEILPDPSGKIHFKRGDEHGRRSGDPQELAG